MNEGAALLLKDGTFAQLINTDPLRVNVMVQDPSNVHQLVLNDDENNEREVTENDIAEYCNVEKLESMRAHKKAWMTVGCRLIKCGDTGDVFVSHKVEQTGALIDVGDGSTSEDEEEDATDGMHGYENDGFVVPDGYIEPFTHADPNEDEVREGGSDTVQEINASVRAYKNWVPVTEDEKRFRSWMDKFEKRIAHADDEQQFVKGKNVDYNEPPLKKVKK